MARDKAGGVRVLAVLEGVGFPSITTYCGVATRISVENTRHRS